MRGEQYQLGNEVIEDNDSFSLHGSSSSVSTLRSPSSRRNRQHTIGLRSNTSSFASDLPFDFLGPEGGGIIGREIIAKSTTLTSINLASNALSDEGGLAIAMGIQRSSTLTSINLASNRLGNTSAQAIAEAVVQRSCLTTVNLQNNHFGEEIRAAFEDARVHAILDHDAIAPHDEQLPERPLNSTSVVVQVRALRRFKALGRLGLGRRIREDLSVELDAGFQA